MFYKDCNKNYKQTENSLLIDKYVQNCVVYTLNSEKYKYFSVFWQLSKEFFPYHYTYTNDLSPESLQNIKILY